MSERPPRLYSALPRLFEPRDIASLAVLRALLGGLMFVSTVRFLANGWVERFFVTPTFFFNYWGFEWITVRSPEVMLALHVGIAVSALMISVGLFYRVATVAFFLLFNYVELVDVTNYLNHYYLVSLLSFLFCLLPLNGAYSLDVWRNPSLRRDTVPAWMVYLLRFQVAVVYFYAGIAKLQSDWLLHAQPLGIWLAARSELPVLGPVLAIPWVAWVFSWAGFLNDIFVAPLLLWKRTRPYAYATVLVFHGFTHLLFTIGIFPILMPLAGTVFFESDWPRRVAPRLRRFLPRISSHSARGTPNQPPPRRWLAAALVAWCAVQVMLPLRTFAYGGNVLWHEQGMRWSWRVMVREKNGSITYRVRARGWPRERQVPPSQYLTSHQEREMSGQPDMILQLAHHIADDYVGRGEEDVEVRVDALVSLNGRPAAPLIDPDVDLAQVDDDLAPATWILPSPTTPPLSVWRAGT